MTIPSYFSLRFLCLGTCCLALSAAAPAQLLDERDITFSRGETTQPENRATPKGRFDTDGPSISMRDLAATEDAGHSNLFIENDPVVSREMRRQVVKSMSMHGGGPVERELERNFGDNIQDVFYDEVRRSDPTLADRTLDGAMTYYFIDMWKTANQAYSYWPNDRSVKALRKQVLEKLSQPNTVPTRPAELQREAESIMYAIITARQVQKNALEDRSEHRMQLISDQTQEAMLKQGFDMRNLEFGEKGLQPREKITADEKTPKPEKRDTDSDSKFLGLF